jgi:UDP-N-acetylmuramate dehydrogenase
VSAELEAVAAHLAPSMGERVVRHHPIGPLTTYRVGGAAALFVRVESDADLALLVTAITDVSRHGGAPAVLVVGKGSNLLIADAGFDGIAVQLGDAFAEVDVDVSGVVRAGGAAPLPVVARRTAAAGLAGFEWAVGVPGSIGGAVRMNAGGHGSDMAAVLTRVRVCDLATGHDDVVDVAQLDLAYRHSAVAPNELVVWAELELAPGDVATSTAVIDDVVRWRREHQPGGANAGSVFTNPPDDSAGRLIDEAGCKGMRLGSAEVSAKHANFIQADLGGHADDVAALMAAVRDRVRDSSGIELAAETRLVGFDPTEIERSGSDS